MALKDFIWYGGKKCIYQSTIVEGKDCNEHGKGDFMDVGQAMIDYERRNGRDACFIHDGKSHYFYVEVRA